MPFITYFHKYTYSSSIASHTCTVFNMSFFSIAYVDTFSNLNNFCSTFLINHYYYNIISSEFFTPALVESLSLECEWQQVSLSLKKFFQYSGRSQQCCSLDGLDSFSDFLLFKFCYQVLLLLLLLFTPLEFFTSVLADGFSLEFEWQQVSSSL